MNDIIIIFLAGILSVLVAIILLSLFKIIGNTKKVFLIIEIGKMLCYGLFLIIKASGMSLMAQLIPFLELILLIIFAQKYKETTSLKVVLYWILVNVVGLSISFYMVVSNLHIQ